MATPQPDQMLIEPSLSKIASLVNQGALTPADMAKPVTTTWPSRLPPELLPFLTSLDLGQLAEAVKVHPSLLWHPLVQRQVWHLQRLLKEAAPWYDDDAYKSAHSALRRLIEAWVQGVLRGRWRLTPLGRRGRKVSVEDLASRYQLLQDYEEVLVLLRREKNVRPHRGESETAWSARLGDIIKRVWANSSLANKYTTETPAGADPLDLFQVTLKTETLSLPPALVKQWVAEVTDRAAEGAIRDQIAYRLLGYRPRLTADQVRGRIDSARKLDKLT